MWGPIARLQLCRGDEATLETKAQGPALVPRQLSFWDSSAPQSTTSAGSAHAISGIVARRLANEEKLAESDAAANASEPSETCDSADRLPEAAGARRVHDIVLGNALGGQPHEGPRQLRCRIICWGKCGLCTKWYTSIVKFVGNGVLWCRCFALRCKLVRVAPGSCAMASHERSTSHSLMWSLGAAACISSVALSRTAPAPASACRPSGAA